MRRVVVTGCGVVSSVGIGEGNFWESLIAGKSGIDRISRFDPQGFDSQIAGEVKDFDPSPILSPKDIKRTALFVQFALCSAKEAIEKSGLKLDKLDPYRVGVIIGSGIGSLEVIEEEYKVFLSKGPKRISPFLIPMLITNEAAGMVAIFFGFKGVNLCTVTACASGAHAIADAYLLIQQGRADVVVCGGTESCITHLGLGGFCALKALSTRNDQPQRASRPFDKERDGFVMGEGAGIVVLEELEHAKRRGAEIYCEVGGYGATCDAYHITAPDPEGEAPAKAMELALKEAKVDLEDNIYINAHGTSTPLNDKMETRAIKRAFGNFAKKVHISSTKSMMGHTLGAAGAIEFIVACLAVKNKIIPPTINYEFPDPECDLDYTPNKAKELDIKVALSNSLGFGGHNISLSVKEFS
ncbi:MAG: beta-ketoacyl-ACP synthase II [Candidatus Omnitrophica bacterium]|nr:beta-ketoacyl-ACP synthase II [Candidatus Omnitrophota bacterium]